MTYMSLINLSQTLEEFLEQYALSTLEHGNDAYLRAIVVGPPIEALELVFNRLTANGTSDWQISCNGSLVDITVLLVRGHSKGQSLVAPSPEQSYASCECSWDYTVTIRNARQRVIILVDLSTWINLQDSLANTTEILGSARTNQGSVIFRDSLWRFIIQSIATNTSTNTTEIRWVLREVTKQAKDLEPAISNLVPWVIADNLLARPDPTLTSADTVALAVGLPSIDDTGLPLKDSLFVLDRLVELLVENGLVDAFEKLKATSTAQSLLLQRDLDDLLHHIKQRAVSSVMFAIAPSWFYLPGPVTPAWWKALNAERIAQMLDEIEGPKPQPLEVRCENALNLPFIKGEPPVVLNEVRLRASAPRGKQLPAPAFSRKDDGTLTALPSMVRDIAACLDPTPPPHSKPIRYTVEAASFAASSIDVVSLQSFECHGFARTRRAIKNRLPTKPKSQKEWTQVLSLTHGGLINLDIYFSLGVDSVEVWVPHDAPGPTNVFPVQSPPPISLPLDVEDNDDVKVVLKDKGGNSIGDWKISFSIQEPAGTVQTRFQSLILAHQEPGKRRMPIPAQNWAQELESRYLSSQESWKPILAAWHGVVGSPLLNWEDPRLGDASPHIDPRPQFVPPQPFLEAREALRNNLLAEVEKKDPKSIAAIDLNKSQLVPLIEQYLSSYIDWLQAAPREAAWLDSIAIHACWLNVQSTGYSVSEEPVAILLSPLHPLKIAWHSLAQEQMERSLEDPCPAVGLLDPARCPDIGTWYLNQAGGVSTPRSFQAASCDNPHWSVLWNTSYHTQADWRRAILGNLADMGLASREISGGFSSKQAINSLNEVSRLLPGRATIRIGIIGTEESSPACVDGVIEWCSTFGDYAQDEVRSFDAEIYDMRQSTYPSPEKLAELSEQTQEKIKWYKLEDIRPSQKLDLVILDQLGIQLSSGREGLTRSPIGPGGMYRIRLREDLENALVLKESRVGKRLRFSGGLAGSLEKAITAFEEIATSATGITHFQFQPNQQAIGKRIGQSIYLAVTSSQIDPACIVRGVQHQSAYLWDYELPGILGADEDSAGYYLIARPSTAMRTAIVSATRLVTAAPPDIDALLREISQRGIPILKQFARGGSQSRAELGLLLAVRFLQDAFRGEAGKVHLPVQSENCIHLLLPVDPYQGPFDLIRSTLDAGVDTKRADLLVFAIHFGNGNEPLALKITPVEVKFREDLRTTSSRTISDEDENFVLVLRDFLRQAESMGELLEKLWCSTAKSDLWETCRFALLAQCLDFAFRIYSDTKIHKMLPTEWAEKHQKVLEEVVNGRASISVNRKGRLLVFGGSSATSIIDLDDDSLKDTVILHRDDAEVLLSGVGHLSTQAQRVVKLLDFSFPSCVPVSEQDKTAADSKTVVPSAITPTLERPSLWGEVLEEITVKAFTSKAGVLKGNTTSDNQVEAKFPRTLSQEIKSPVSPVPSMLREQVRNAFAGFVGNENAVNRVTKDLLRALIEKPPHLSKNYLFTGQPSTGKTELARRMAIALGLPFVWLDGRSVGSRERLFDLVRGELGQQELVASEVGKQAGLPVMKYPPLVIFIDEVHLLPRSLQEGLLTMLEDADRTVTLSNQVAKVNSATFLFATTRASDVDSAFRSRCTLIHLQEYNLEEVAQILQQKLLYEWPKEIYLEIAQLGRGVPRIALQLAEELDTEIKVSEHFEYSLHEHLEEVRKASDRDEIGLTSLDLDYLSVLEHENKPVGEQTLLNLLGTVDKDRVTGEVEPFLVKLGFLKLGGRGREITTEGRRYILQKRLR